MKDIEYYTVDDFDIALNDIRKKTTNSLTPSDKPKLYTLVIQPGAGKSTLQEVVINSDDYRNAVTNAIMNKLSDQGYNILILKGDFHYS